MLIIEMRTRCLNVCPLYKKMQRDMSISEKRCVQKNFEIAQLLVIKVVFYHIHNMHNIHLYVLDTRWNSSRI
jgi:hypothetical protein